MAERSLGSLRREIDRLNQEILALIQRRADLVLQIAALKRSTGLDGYDPSREEEMLERLTAVGGGAFAPSEIREIFTAIFRASLDIQDRERRRSLRVTRRDLVPPEGIRVGNVAIGAGASVLFAGPCSVETPEQMDEVGRALSLVPGPKVLRAGAFKPRTSPYAFQGLREEGLRILRDTAERYELPTVTEVLDVSTLDVVAAHTDMLQVGARNMYNTELLKAVGRLRKPVLLKRGFMATLDELLLSAEYILSEGNDAVVLCERGIRTFEPWTRNTLDISAIPLLQKETSLPVIVDLSHALGRKDILLPCGRAALAAGANGLMIEIHPYPDQALSDGFQQLDLDGFRKLLRDLGLGEASAKKPRKRRAAGRRVAMK
ncbi:MAG: bifunctional 3-deoxy-7-phosphoheptulonate synthase/chorismate mutase [bacterium]